MTNNSSNLPPTNRWVKEYLRAVISFVSALAFCGFYIWLIMSYPAPQPPNTEQHEFVSLLIALIPNFIAGLFAFAFLFFLFDSKGIKFSDPVREQIARENEVLKSLIIERTQKVVELSEEQETLIRQNQRLLDLFEAHRRNENEILTRLHRSQGFPKDLANDLLSQYFKNYSVRKDGFHLRGEFVVIETANQLWTFLAKMQRKRKEFGEAEIIARVVHSNDINIWTNEHSKYKEMLKPAFDAQAEFVALGGKIVRVLIGPEQKENKQYKKALEEMTRIGIEAKYLWRKEVHEMDFDYLMLIEEGVIMKWFSGNYGHSIVSAQINDKMESQPLSHWDHIFNVLDKKGTPIKSIPPERQYVKKDEGVFVSKHTGERIPAF